MRFDVLTLFPDLLRPFGELGVFGRAIDRGLISLNLKARYSKPFLDRVYGRISDLEYLAGLVERLLHARKYDPQTDIGVVEEAIELKEAEAEAAK